jgi:5-methylcytosine-specific restriction endonuclease McrA
MQKHIQNYINKYGLEDYKPCEVCGITNGVLFHFHHIVFRSKGRDDSAENICYLCNSCHRRSHFLEEPYITVEQLQLLTKDRE